MPRHLPIVVNVATYLIVGLLYLTRTPAWQAPDEPAHYNYVRQLSDGRLPVMEMGDYDQHQFGTRSGCSEIQRTVAS